MYDFSRIVQCICLHYLCEYSV
uniref:Uncharacterized protein n=1 Tax=Anopheles quadriannulatus TaxID=34691 RepID=A0A182XSU0_ANOQN